MRERIFEFLDSQAASVIEWQRALTGLVAIGPDNGGRGERAKADYLRAELEKLGFSDIREINAPDSRVPSGHRPNIAACLPGKLERRIWIMGHMDVVPPGDPGLWQSDPHSLKVDGDTLIGRGVEDNQQAIVSGLLAAKAFTALGVTPHFSLGLLFVSDEETHSAYGLTHVLEAEPGLIWPEDLVLVPDSGSPDGSLIEVAEKNIAWLKITVTGRQCHASTPDEGINSLKAASACVLALDKLHELFPLRDPLFRPEYSTFVPSKKEPNVENINTVPGLDVFYMDCRLMPGVKLDDVLREARRLAVEAVRPYGAEVKVESLLQDSEAPPTPTDCPVVTRLLDSLARLRGIQGKPLGIGGQTVAAVLRRKNLHAAVWSTIEGNAHAPNERSSIKNTIADAKIFADMAMEE